MARQTVLPVGERRGGAMGGGRGQPARAALARVDRGAAALVGTLAALLLWLSFLPTTAQTARLAEAPGWLDLGGFYGPEANAAFSYRWSQPEARLTLPVPPAGRYALTLTLGDAPGAAAPRTLAVTVNGATVATLQPDGALRDYRLEYARPAGAAPAAPLRVGLATEARRVPGDARELGFVVAAARWEAIGAPLLWRAGAVAAWLLILGLGYALLDALRRGRGVRPALIALAAAGVLSWPLTAGRIVTLYGLFVLWRLAIVRRAPDERGILGELAGQRWLAALALLCLWVNPPLLLDPDNPNHNLRGYVAATLIGAAAVRWLAARHPRLGLAAYAAASGSAAIWWWAVVAPPLAALPQLAAADQTAIRLVPWVVVAFAAANCALAWLLPPPAARALLLADLVAGLGAVALPAGLWLARRGGYSPLEESLRVSWAGGLLILLIAAKAAGGGLALARAAPAVATERRVALALLALLLATGGALAPWRLATLGLTGDEPGYLAAARSLAFDRDTELTNNGYAPWMVARALYPVDAWGQEIPDERRDRFAAGAGASPATRHELPVVAGPGLAGQIGIVNAAAAPATITVRLDGGAPERFVLTPAASRLIAVPAGADWRGATIEADAPVAATVRLATDGGALDAYAPAPPAARACLALPGGAARATTLIVRNGGDAPAAATVGGASLPIPPGGSARLPLPASAEPRGACVVADRPLTALAVSQDGDAGLLALPALPPGAAPLPIPPAPTTTQATGAVVLLAHNPGDAPVTIRRGGTDRVVATLAPGTAQRIELEPGSAAEERPLATLVPDGPIATTFLATLARHEAALTPAAPAATTWFPAITGEARRFVASRVVVQNPTAEPLPVVIALLDDAGRERAARRVVVCGSCVAAARLDFADDAGELIAAEGAIVVRADRPAYAAVAQLTLQSRGFNHQWGLPALLVPGLALGGALGAVLTVVFCWALLLAQCYGLLRDAGVARRPALAAILALGLAPPLLPFGLLLYPELPATLALVTGLRLALGAAPLRGRRLAAVGGCALAIPLFHARLIPLAAILVAGGIWRALGPARLDRRALLRLATALLAALAIGAAWWLARPYLPAPLALSARLNPTALGYYFAASNLGHHLAGVFLDRATGLLPAAPLLALAAPGLLTLARRAPRYAAWATALIAAQVAVVALRADGWEAWGPAGRYLLPIVPLLALGVAAAWDERSPRWLRPAGAALAAWGWLVALAVAWVPQAPYYFIPDRKWFGDLLLRAWGWPNPLRLFPEILASLPFAPSVALPYLLALLLLTLAGVRWRREKGTD